MGEEVTIVEVQEYYRTPPIDLGGGKWGCPMPSCGHVGDTPQSIGPHKAAHARRLGLLAPTGQGNRTNRKFAKHRQDGSRMLAQHSVPCPFPGCGKLVSRGHLKPHYRTIHRRSGTDAAKACDPVLAATRVGSGGRPGPASSQEVAPLGPPAQETKEAPHLNGYAIDIPDAVTAVLMGTTGKEVVALVHLPEIIRLALHTQAVVDLVKEG